MSHSKPVHPQGRKSLSRPTTTSSTMTSRKSLASVKASTSNNLFSPTDKKNFGLNNLNTKEETPSPAFSTLASSKALNRTERQDSFSAAVDSFKNARRESIMSMKWGDASTKASSLASLNATLASIPKLKSRTTFTAQSLSMLPSEALGTSHHHQNAVQSMNDVETKKYIQESELPSRNDLLSDREYELGGTLNNLEEKFADLEQVRNSCSTSIQEIFEVKKPATARPPSSKRGKINNNNYVLTPRIERQPSIAEKINAKKGKTSNEAAPKLSKKFYEKRRIFINIKKIEKRKSVVIVKKSQSSKKGNNKNEVPLIPLARKFDKEKSPVKVLSEPRSAGKLDLGKIIQAQAREMERSQEEVPSPRFDSTRLDTMDEVQENSFRSNMQPKFIVRRDFLGSARSLGSQNLRKQSLEKPKSPVKDVFLNKPLETILSNYHENIEKSVVEFKIKTDETLPIDTIASIDENYQNVSVEQKPNKKVEVMNWFKDKLPEETEKKANLKVLELISRRNLWRKVEEEAAENKRSEASPDCYQSILKHHDSRNWLELNMDNKYIQEYSSSGQKNISGPTSFNLKKDIRSNSSTMMVRHFDEFDPVVIQPKYMEETGSMCFTELWGNKNKNEFYRTMRKAFQSNTFVNLEPHCGLYRPQKGLTSEELMCRRIANGGLSMTERKLSVKIPEEMPLPKKDHFSPRGVGKHTRAFVLQIVGRVKNGTRNNFGSL